MEHCFYHPDREAVAVCSKCKKPLCKECAITYNGKIYCKECFEELKSTMQKKETVKSEESIKAVILAIIISAIIIGGIILMALIIKNRNGNTVQKPALAFACKENTITINANINGSDLKIINVQNSNSKITINGVNIHPDASYENGILTVKATNFNLWHKNEDSYITIGIPPMVKKANLDIDNKLGNIHISLPFSKIETGKIYAKIGEITVENCNADTLNLTGAVGSITMSNNSVSHCTVKTGTGNCTVNSGVFYSLKIKQGVGNFQINSITKLSEFTYEGGTGNFEFDFSKTHPPLTANISTGIGKTEIEIGKNPARLTITAAMGIINDMPFLNSTLPEKGRVFTYGDIGKPHFEINITSGGKVQIRR